MWMTTIYLPELDTKSFGVKIEDDNAVIVQKIKKIFDEEKNILCVKSFKIFLGKCDVTNMLIKIGSFL